MEEEREEQKLKNPSELKDSENLRERFVRIFSDVDKNNPINIDIDKEAWPIFLKVVEDYSHAEIMNAPDTEIVKKCISVKEIFFEQKNIITDGNGNPNIAANLKANPNFIEQNPEVREVLDHMHVDSKIDILFSEKDEMKFFNAFLSLSSEDIESISQEDFEDLIEEKGYNLFKDETGKANKERAKKWNESIKGNGNESIDLENAETCEEFEITESGMKLSSGEIISFGEFPDFVENNSTDKDETQSDRRAKEVKAMGFEKYLAEANFTDEQYEILIKFQKGHLDSKEKIDFEQADDYVKIGNVKIPRRMIVEEMRYQISYENGEMKLINGMTITSKSIKLPNGKEIAISQANNVPINIMKEIKDEEAKEFVEDSAEELDVSAISYFQRKSSEDRAKQNRVVSDAELKNSRTERIETSGITPEKGRAGATVNSKQIAESNVDVTRTKKSEIEQQITARDKTQEEGTIGQDIKIDDREETDYKKKSILSRMVDMASRAINSLRGENDDIHNKTDNPKALMEYREKRNFWSGIISRLGFSETETYKKLSEEVTEEVSKDENSKNTNRFFRFMNAITGKSKEEKTAVEEDKNKIEQNAFDKYNATVNEEKAIADAKVAQEKMYAQKGNNEQEEVK